MTLRHDDLQMLFKGLIMFMPGNKGWHLFIRDIEGTKAGKSKDVWVSVFRDDSYFERASKIGCFRASKPTKERNAGWLFFTWCSIVHLVPLLSFSSLPVQHTFPPFQHIVHLHPVSPSTHTHHQLKHIQQSPSRHSPPPDKT